MKRKLTIISGGQTGADIGGLRAANSAGIETAGWMPKGWLTEEGSHPDYAELYGLKECDTSLQESLEALRRTDRRERLGRVLRDSGAMLKAVRDYLEARPVVEIPEPRVKEAV